MKKFLPLLALVLSLIGCNKDDGSGYTPTPTDPYPAITAAFGDNIDPENLPNYSGQTIPAYINRDNTEENVITNAGATLGRVLFYDKKLSSNNTISCASCHQQAHAFGDPLIASEGVNGVTTRHTMRLVNARYGFELKFFWDERAATLEAQTTQPIQNHVEMGFSGQNGDQTIEDLVAKLQAIDYYKELFTLAYGDNTVTETRIQNALAQFVRSIASFDTKYDAGRAQVNNNNAPFPNFTQQENQGKQLFTAPPIFDGTGNRTGGGVGCAGCHAGPEFDINPDSQNNGVTTTIDPALTIDLENTRAPSLRDIVKKDGTLNGPFMHDGSFATLEAVIEHYNSEIEPNRSLDPRLRPGGNVQRLNMTTDEKAALKAFLMTLGGQNVYTDAKWSNPFSGN